MQKFDLNNLNNIAERATTIESFGDYIENVINGNEQVRLGIDLTSKFDEELFELLT